MNKFKGTKGKWFIGEGWLDQHVSISSPAHGAARSAHGSKR